MKEKPKAVTSEFFLQDKKVLTSGINGVKIKKEE